jgi:predicted DNA-binding protein (UPF0251 family)
LGHAAAGKNRTALKAKTGVAATVEVLGAAVEDVGSILRKALRRSRTRRGGFFRTMARPTNCRRVGQLPLVTYFKPRGIPLRELEEVVLAVDELEAVRLADLEGLYQEQAAEQMHVSRQTFGRIVESAHRKVAEALVKGKALRIEGGEFQMNAMRTFFCTNCEQTWRIPYGTGRPAECPACHGKDFHRVEGERGQGRSRRNRHRMRAFERAQ